MAKSVDVVIHLDSDEDVLQEIGDMLRSNRALGRQIRDFAATYKEDQFPRGLKFEPLPGQMLICHFGLGFQKPEIIKTRPVIVVSPKYHEARKLCTVVPISSIPPKILHKHHLKLPKGLVPDEKYNEAWVKGDLIQTVSIHRLDRFKVGHRKYIAPVVPEDILRDIRRCVLHATGQGNRI